MRTFRGGFAGLVGAVIAMILPGGSAHADPPGSADYLATLFVKPLPVVEDLRLRTPAAPGPAWSGLRRRSLLRGLHEKKIRSVTFNTGGSSLSLRLEFEDGSAAAFKPEQIHKHSTPRYEIAAYHINKLLGLTRVPPATWRSVPVLEIYHKLTKAHKPWFYRIRKEGRARKDILHGEVSWWIPKLRYIRVDKYANRLKWYRWMRAENELPTSKARLVDQLSKMIIFDFIINNPDRYSGNNTLGTPDGRYLYLMDNTSSFRPQRSGSGFSRGFLKRVERFSRRVYFNLRRLNMKRLKASLATVRRNAPWPILTRAEMKAVIQRRDYAVDYINRVIARYGWEKVMVFP